MKLDSTIFGRVFGKLERLLMPGVLSDKTYIKIIYFLTFFKKIDLENPKTFNEKINWLHLYWFDPIAIKCADKFLVREFVKERVGEHILTELLGVYDTVDELNISELPDKFVLKATHGSQYNIICKNKKDVLWEKELKNMRKWLKVDYFLAGREWVYQGIKPRIVCEKYLESGDDKPLKDYKFFCFNGEPKFLFIASDRGIGTKFDFFDLAWNRIPVKQYYPNSAKEISKPENWDTMLDYARKLSKGFPHVRVDFYSAQGKVYFGELTFFHFGGLKKFVPKKFDLIFGNDFPLPSKQNVQK